MSEPPSHQWTPESLPEPWFVIEDHLRPSFEAEVGREVSGGHPLDGEVVVAVAKCGHCDSVVFSVERQPVEWALVHLTWSKGPESAPFPLTSVYPSLGEAVAAHDSGW